MAHHYPYVSIMPHTQKIQTTNKSKNWFYKPRKMIPKMISINP